MSAHSVALAATVISALLWSTFDGLRKRLVGGIEPIPLTCALALGQAPLYFAWAAYDGFGVVEASYIAPGIGVWVVNLAANILFFESLRRADLSATVPMLSLTPVFASILGVFLLDEHLKFGQTVGVTLVVAGALGLNLRGRRDDKNAIDPAKRRAQIVAGVMMVTVAALWATTAVLDKVSMRFSSIAMHAFMQTAGLGATLVIWLGLRGEIGKLRAVASLRWSFIIGCVLSGTALGLQLFAVMGAHVGLIEAVKRAIGAMLALLFGRLFFGEAVDRTKLLSVTAMAVGVWFVVL